MAARVPGSRVIHNWADKDLSPVPHEANDLRVTWGLGRSFVVGYSGNLGRAHDLDTVVRAAAILEEDPATKTPVRFLFIGGGAKLESVQRETGRTALFLPYQPRELLSRSLSAADVHLVTLLPSLEGLIVPSKFYGALAVARPVLFVGSPEGEIATLVRETGCGRVVRSGDAAGLAQTIRDMAADPEGIAAMGRRGLELHHSRFAREHAFAAWDRVLGEAV